MMAGKQQIYFSHNNQQSPQGRTWSRTCIYRANKLEKNYTSAITINRFPKAAPGHAHAYTVHINSKKKESTKTKYPTPTVY